MTFVHPSFLWALLLIPLLTAAYILLLQRRHATLVLSAFYRLKAGGIRTHIRHLPFALEMLALAALIIALARPQNTNSWQKDNVEGIDIMLAIDASGSMMAMDLQPNRFVAAVEVAQKFIGNRPNDNIGLVMFAGESFTQCRPCNPSQSPIRGRDRLPRRWYRHRAGDCHGMQQTQREPCQEQNNCTPHRWYQQRR